jgi:hypothetical protein
MVKNLQKRKRKMAKNKCKCTYNVCVCKPVVGYTSTSTTGQPVIYKAENNERQVYQDRYIDFKIEKAVFMLLKKIDKLEDKIQEIETNCSCQ